MDSKRSIVVSGGSAVGNRLRVQAHAVPLFPQSSSPKHRRESALGTEPACALSPKGAWNQMNSNRFNRSFEPADDDEIPNGRVDDAMAHSKISEGARAVNRLLWSFLLLLLPLIWNCSDWIGLLILSQALFVAAKLIQPSVARAKSSTSPAHGVLVIHEGEDCAHG